MRKTARLLLLIATILSLISPISLAKAAISRAECIQIYEPVLAEYRDYLLRSARDDEMGLDEPWSTFGEVYRFSENPAEEFGYALEDIDGNGIPELILIYRDANWRELRMRALYTVVANSPRLLSTFWDRSSGIITNSGTIQTHGSSGAMNFSYGTYRIAKDGRSMEFLSSIGMESYDAEWNDLEEPRWYEITGKDHQKSIISEDEADEKLSSHSAWNGSSKNAMDLLFVPILGATPDDRHDPEHLVDAIENELNLVVPPKTVDTRTDTLKIHPGLMERCGMHYDALKNIYGNDMQVKYAEYEGYYTVHAPDTEIRYDFYDEAAFTGKWGDADYLDSDKKTSDSAICYQISGPLRELVDGMPEGPIALDEFASKLYSDGYPAAYEILSGSVGIKFNDQGHHAYLEIIYDDGGFVLPNAIARLSMEDDFSDAANVDPLSDRVKEYDTGKDDRATPTNDETAAGANLLDAMTKDERRALNIFFSNFSESDFTALDIGNYDETSLIEFALRYHYANRSPDFSSAGDHYLRISADRIDQTLARFFGITAKSMSKYSIPHPAYPQYYQDGYLYYPDWNQLADGEASKWSHVTKFLDNKDGTFTAVIDTYIGQLSSLDDIYGDMVDWPSDEIRKDYSCTAIVKPYDNNGRATYQLIALYPNGIEPVKEVSITHTVPGDYSQIAGQSFARYSIYGEPFTISIYKIDVDGSFKGAYHGITDFDAGTAHDADDYRTTPYRGKFSPPTKIRDGEYAMQVESIEVDGPDSADQERLNMIGIFAGDQFRLYLPGVKAADLPQNFLDWQAYQVWGELEMNESELPPPDRLTFYAMYNLTTDGAFSQADQSMYASGYTEEHDQAIYAPDQSDLDDMYVVNCQEYVSLRQYPSQQAERICKVPLHARVTPISQSDDGHFWKVSYGGETGYISADYLASSISPNRLSNDNSRRDDTVSPNHALNIPHFDHPALSASLNQKMATRTGPNTKYTEPGTFPQSTHIRVFYQTSGNGVMWGMVEFKSGGMWYRLYTGMKRIDARGVPKDSEKSQSATIARDVTPRYGPGSDYASQPDTIPDGSRVKVFFQENDYAMVDYDGGRQVVRGWVPMSALKSF